MASRKKSAKTAKKKAAKRTAKKTTPRGASAKKATSRAKPPRDAEPAPAPESPPPDEGAPDVEPAPAAKGPPRSKEEQRRELLDAASRVLVKEGAQAVTTRRLASEIGASTMSVYTVFGGKDALVEQLHLEGFERLGDALAAVEPHPDPLFRLAQLLAAYREMALANPTWYALMYGQPIAGFSPPNANAVRGTRAFVTLEECVQRCVESGALEGSDAGLITDVLWASVHGHVSLELAGYFQDEADAETRFVETLRVSVDGFAAPAQ